MEASIWILSNYANELTLLKQAFDLIMKNLGDLDFEYYNDSEGSTDATEDSNKTDLKRTITKTVVLPDGTYGTVTQELDVKEIKKQKEIKYLRKFILESNFYFSANLVSALTNIIFKMKKLKFDKYNIYYFNTINIICSILKMNSKIVVPDPDNVNHIAVNEMNPKRIDYPPACCGWR